MYSLSSHKLCDDGGGDDVDDNGDDDDDGDGEEEEENDNNNKREGDNDDDECYDWVIVEHMPFNRYKLYGYFSKISRQQSDNVLVDKQYKM